VGKKEKSNIAKMLIVDLGLGSILFIELVFKHCMCLNNLKNKVERKLFSLMFTSKKFQLLKTIQLDFSVVFPQFPSEK
jgi:hypothetical protein